MDGTSSSMEGRGKRRLEGGDYDDEHQQPVRNRRALPSVIIEARKVDCPHCSSLEPIIRRVVSEEFERFLTKLGCARLIGRSSPQRIKGPDGRNLQLHFKSRISLPLFTGGKVEGEQGAAIHVELIDANTVYVVTSGPESSVKLDVVVLEGDFNNEDDQGWSQEEFDKHVVKERYGKRPLLTGDVQVTLKEGVGTLRDLTFTDNSSWTRSKKFRLGLKVSTGYCEGVRIREAKTKAFIVRDHRGELYKKHYPPALIDQVWRLENIKKDGSFHKKLNVIGIYTVEDFLRLLVRDSKELRNTLGSGMSSKMWDALIEHARTCLLSGKLYVYYPDESRNVGVVFNNIYELSGLVDSDQYFPEDSLSNNQKVDVDNWVKKAYDNWNQIVEYDGKTLLKKQTKKSSTSQSDLPLVPVNYPHTSDNQLPPWRLPVSVPFGSSSMDQSMLIGGSSYNDNMTQLINSNTCSQFEPASFTQQVSLTNQMTSTSYGNGVGFALGPSHSSPLDFGFAMGPSHSSPLDFGFAIGPSHSSPLDFGFALGPSHSSPFDSSLQQTSVNPFENWSNNLDKSVEVFLSDEENDQILPNEDMQHLIGNEFSIDNASVTVPEVEMLENKDMQHLLGNEFSVGSASVTIPEDEMPENKDMQHSLLRKSLPQANVNPSEEEIRMRSPGMLDDEDMQYSLRLFGMGGHGSGNVPEDGFNFTSDMPLPSPGLSYGEDHRAHPGEAVVGWLKTKPSMRWGLFVRTRKRAAARRATIVELR